MPKKFRKKLKSFRLFFFPLLLCNLSATNKNLYTLGMSVIEKKFLNPPTNKHFEASNLT